MLIFHATADPQAWTTYAVVARFVHQSMSVLLTKLPLLQFSGSERALYHPDNLPDLFLEDRQINELRQAAIRLAISVLASSRGTIEVSGTNLFKGAQDLTDIAGCVESSCRHSLEVWHSDWFENAMWLVGGSCNTFATRT